MKNKFMLIGVLALAATLLLSACAQPTPAPTPVPSTETPVPPPTAVPSTPTPTPLPPIVEPPVFSWSPGGSIASHRLPGNRAQQQIPTPGSTPVREPITWFTPP